MAVVVVNGEMSRLIRDSESGFVYPPGDAGTCQFVGSIDDKNHELLDSMSKMLKPCITSISIDSLP